MSDQARSSLVHPGGGHPDPYQPEVAILLCTYNGQKHLADQLESISSQTHHHWKVYASDDRSTDATPDILRAYASKWGGDRMVMYPGPAKGCTANFLSLICRNDIHADYFAYADQDDIWETDKLERAVAWFKTLPHDKPALYCSRTRLVNEDNCETGLSPLFRKPPGFANALTQNIGGGNTMVLNRAARQLLADASREVDVTLHDWWTYIVVSGCGGAVFYDPHPTLRYRQHEANLVGCGNTGRYPRFKGAVERWQNQWKGWNDKHLIALDIIRPRLTSKNKQILEQFCAARKSRLLPRLWGLKRCGLYRQTLWGNLALVMAAIFNKL